MTPERRLELLSASRLGLAVLGDACFAREGLVLVEVRSGVRRWVRPENVVDGKKVPGKKTSGTSKRKTPSVEPVEPSVVSEPVVAPEPAIDYMHKDANHPVVIALRGNPKAEAALKAVLSLKIPEQAELDKLRENGKKLAEEQVKLSTKKRKKHADWGRVGEILTEQRQSAVRQIEIESKITSKLRDAALDALQQTLRTDDMRGVENAPFNKGDPANRDAVPITATAHWEAHRVATGVANRFVASCLSGHCLRVTHVAMPTGGRACCGHGSTHNVIFNEPLGKSGRLIAKTCVHELGHAVQNQKPGVTAMAVAFLKYRVGDEPMTDLHEKFGYDEGEMGRKDNFDRAFGDGSSAYYVGKGYGLTGNTEIVSMGLEAMYANPIEFARKDPEYFQFMAHILSMPTL